mmetsp:Transcript_117982/g.338396  ORF Transcript_117982/g.338396 Transcript_117982/m.338396 type:complete len:214 (-) Transcript_117982:203-844(-)
MGWLPQIAWRRGFGEVKGPSRRDDPVENHERLEAFREHGALRSSSPQEDRFQAPPAAKCAEHVPHIRRAVGGGDRGQGDRHRPLQQPAEEKQPLEVQARQGREGPGVRLQRRGVAVDAVGQQVRVLARHPLDLEARLEHLERAGLEAGVLRGHFGHRTALTFTLEHQHSRRPRHVPPSRLVHRRPSRGARCSAFETATCPRGSAPPLSAASVE